MNNVIIRATDGPKHHLFGFHDLVAFNQTGDKVLSLEADVINRPPLAGEKFGVGYSLWEEKRFVKLGETTAMNYPQGARQQWMSNHEFIVNNRVGDHWGADIYDIELGNIVSTIDSTAHCVTKDGKWAFGINYSRLFRLGGYGYNGLEDTTRNECAPKNDGIFITDIGRNSTKLLISIADVVKVEPATSNSNGSHHYITHLCLSPDNQRLAFLHRFFLPDGGIRTRLMTIGVNGEDCRCIASGFLSHFDWKDNNNIFIWGKTAGGIDAIRSNPLLTLNCLRPLVKIAKTIVRSVSGNKLTNNKHFLLVKDSYPQSITPFAVGPLQMKRESEMPDAESGLAMAVDPEGRIDTVPEEKDVGAVSAVCVPSASSIKSDSKVDASLEDLYLKDIDPKIRSMVSSELLSFTRSGLHCDLHPRWDANGEMVAFDSIHEGTRQIYVVRKC